MTKYLSLFLILFALSACETTPHEYGLGDPVKPLSQTEQAMISARNAALENKHADIRRGELSQAEKAYRAAPKNVQAAVNYASLLRKVGMMTEADMILSPFVRDVKKAQHQALIEYSKIKISQGQFDTAQIFAQEAMLRDDNAQARLVLGTAVDAQGHHQAAENHYKQGLAKVGTDIKTRNSLLNNLALSLMAQDKMNEAKQALSDLTSMSGQSDTTTVQANKTLLNKL